MKFPNVMLPEGPMCHAEVWAALEQSVVSWDDLPWIRDVWNGPVVVKGVHTGEDARRAVDRGADAIVVEPRRAAARRVRATLRMLPEVVAAVNGQVEVLVDGGIRRGSDIAEALCLGAGGAFLPSTLAGPIERRIDYDSPSSLRIRISTGTPFKPSTNSCRLEPR
jgi:L-lactate dehydrogenase (cytochrome)